MANLQKRIYTDHQTVITAQNMNDIQNVLIANASYVTCSTAANTIAKVGSALPDFILTEGAAIRVKFSYTNTAANPSLNINSTGAKPILWYDQTPVGRTEVESWHAGSVLTMVYDGTNWLIAEQVRELATTTTAGLMAASDKTLVGTIGTVANLTTDAKSNLVAAVNEVDNHTDSANTAIGTLANLTTSAKNNLVAAVNEVNGDVVHVSAQTLTAAQKSQARTNLSLANDTKAGSSWAVNDQIALGGIVFKITGIVS